MLDMQDAVGAVKKTCVMVLGMHRSGTSAMAGVLHACGVYMGSTLLPPAPENTRGFFEDMELVLFNDRLLRTAGRLGTWDSAVLPTNGWLETNEVRDLLPEAVRIIRDEYRQEVFTGMKDPRLCHLVPFWREVLASEGYRTIAVCIYRDPMEVAASLSRRDGFPVEKGILLWTRHVLELERTTRAIGRTFVTYEQLLADPAAVVARIQDELEVTFPRSYRDSEREIVSFLAPDLRHHQKESLAPTQLPSAAADLDRLIRAVSSAQQADDASFRAALDAIYRELEFWLLPASVEARGLDRAFDAERRDLSERAQRQSEEIGRLSAEGGRISAEGGRLSAEVERLSAEVGNLSREARRISEEDQRTLASVRNTIAELTSQLEEKSRRLTDIEGSLAWRTVVRAARLLGKLPWAARALRSLARALVRFRRSLRRVLRRQA